jgi:uncharacterized OsmC-like protein
MTEEEAVIASSGSAGFITEISMRQHRLIADEPVKDGGEDLGPTPYDLLLASLGACTSMTIRLYAGKKKFPLDEVKIYLLQDRVYAEDCEKNCEDSDEHITRIERIIELKGDLSDEQKAKLMEIADKCPVHKTLTGVMKIESFLK